MLFRSSVTKLYSEATEELSGAHYERAIQLFEKLESSYPFGTYAQQAQMQIAYAYYKSQDQAQALANDLRAKLKELRKNEFVTVPETTLPNGTAVPSFKVGKYITGRIDDQLSISESAAPWVKINFADAKAEAEKVNRQAMNNNCLMTHNIQNHVEIIIT